jgi:hypothetical protein
MEDETMMNDYQDTGDWNYYTLEDGFCPFDTQAAAVAAAEKHSAEIGEQIKVYPPYGEDYILVGGDQPTHDERCMRPEVYGYED